MVRDPRACWAWSAVAILAFCHAVGAQPLISSDVEPNDTIGSATVTGLLDFGAVIVSRARIGDGVLGDADRDLYMVDLSAAVATPVVLIVSATSSTGSSLDVYIRVFDAAGFDLARQGDVTGSDGTALLQTYLLRPGTYFVGISDALDPIYAPDDASTGRPAGVGEYNLSIILGGTAGLSTSIEPNDAEPTLINPPFLAGGQFIGDGPPDVLKDPNSPSQRLDVDRFSFEAASPGILRVNVIPDSLGSLDPSVIVTVNGNVATGPDAGLGRSRIRDIELAVPEAGDVEIAIRGTVTAPDEHNRQFGSVGFYSIAVKFDPFEIVDGPLEPNDSILLPTATGLSGVGTWSSAAVIGDGPFAGSRGDVDFLQFFVTPGELLRVDLVASAGLEPVVRLYNGDGIFRGAWYADSNGAIDLEFQLPCADARVPSSRPTPSEYFVAVMGAGDRVTMDTLIPLDRTLNGHGLHVPPIALYAVDGGGGSTGDYDITLTIVGSECAAEPNDVIDDQAPSVVTDSGQFVCRSVPLGDGPCTSSGDAVKNDVDMYPILVDSPPATLDVQMVGCGPEPRTLRLFNAIGNEIARSTADDTVVLPEGATVSLRTEINLAGTYFIAVSSGENDAYDPLEACSGDGGFSYLARYDIDILLVNPTITAPAVAPSPAPVGVSSDAGRLFAIRLDQVTDTLIEIDPATGETLQELQAPESPLGGKEGLAYDGTDLLILGNAARYPILYRLDASTGEILDQQLTWFGSGRYGDMAVVDGLLYVVDLLENAVYVLPMDLGRVIQRFEAGRTLDISMAGAIAALVGPSRLVVTDAVDMSVLHTLSATDGSPLESEGSRRRCPCDADLDADGDVDAADRAIFDECTLSDSIAFGCDIADLDCDSNLDIIDELILECQFNGPGIVPNGGCCPDDLPPIPIRGINLAATGPNNLVVADWADPLLHIVDEQGVIALPIVTEQALGSLAGITFLPMGDADRDHDFDILDWKAFQACHTGDGLRPIAIGCEVFDFDFDDDVDISDFAQWQALATETQP